jgi:hypothetical protein
MRCSCSGSIFLLKEARLVLAEPEPEHKEEGTAGDEAEED